MIQSFIQIDLRVKAKKIPISPSPPKSVNNQGTWDAVIQTSSSRNLSLPSTPRFMTDITIPTTDESPEWSGRTQ